MRASRPLRAFADVALGRQRSPQHDQGPHMVRYLRAANVKDGALDLSDVKEMNFTPAEQVVFSVQPGDVLVSEGSGSLASVGASAMWSGELDGTVCFQNTLVRLRPRPSTDARYLGWWCRHAFADGMFASIASGANIFHVSAERVRSLPMQSWPLEQQRAIADLLDTETARIDALIAKKRRMIELLEERWIGTLVVNVLGDQTPTRSIPQLRRCLTKLTGGSWGGEQGTADLDALCVRGADFDMTRMRVNVESTPSRSFNRAEFAPRRLRRGDLVIEKSGGGDNQPVGRVVEWCSADPAVPTNFAARLVPTTSVQPRFLCLLLRAMYETGRTRAWIKQTTGIQNLDLDGFLTEKTAIPDTNTQQALVTLLDSERERSQLGARLLTRQIELLREHRQALITAAVTGEIDVPGVAA